MDDLRRLTKILVRLEQDPDDEGTRAQARALVERLGDDRLVALEERLAAAGMPHERMRHLCSAHMAVGSGAREAFRASLAEGHPLATFMDEHVQILARLERLSTLTSPGLAAEGEARVAQLTGLAQLGDALVAAEPHHAREEQVLFPALRRAGIDGPPSVMEAEHVEIRALKHAVADGARALLAGQGGWPRLLASAQELVTVLRDHIFKEDNILYPLAARSIPDAARWEELRERCDAIGYCCHQPEPAEAAAGCCHHHR